MIQPKKDGKGEKEKKKADRVDQMLWRIDKPRKTGRKNLWLSKTDIQAMIEIQD